MADELTFHASRSKVVFLVLVSIAFVVGGYFMRASTRKVSRSAHSRARTTSSGPRWNLSGMEGAIPNNYNAPLAEILKTLNDWRARYGTRN